MNDTLFTEPDPRDRLLEALDPQGEVDAGRAVAIAPNESGADPDLSQMPFLSRDDSAAHSGGPSLPSPGARSKWVTHRPGSDDRD